MSGQEAGRTGSAEAGDPEPLEVVPGSQREKLEGWVPKLANPEEVRSALEEAFELPRRCLRSRVKTAAKSKATFSTGVAVPAWQTSQVRVCPGMAAQKSPLPMQI